jgi:hypothetical protein
MHAIQIGSPVLMEKISGILEWDITCLKVWNVWKFIASNHVLITSETKVTLHLLIFFRVYKLFSPSCNVPGRWFLQSYQKEKNDVFFPVPHFSSMLLHRHIEVRSSAWKIEHGEGQNGRENVRGEDIGCGGRFRLVPGVFFTQDALQQALSASNLSILALKERSMIAVCSERSVRYIHEASQPMPCK